jgi:ABC-type transport system involved in multi-copper enzyme maturation permease subunit
MVWIALALLVLTVTIVALNTARGRWNMDHFRWTWTDPAYAASHVRGGGDGLHALNLKPAVIVRYDEIQRGLDVLPRSLGAPPAVAEAVAAAYGAALRYSGFNVFANWIVYTVFLSFLLPIWSLSFATEALGNERESRSLLWLLSRPLSRPAIYLAKFVAVLPWALALNLGGFALICLAAGAPGKLAWQLFWLPIVGATLAFCSVFHLMGALFRRAAVAAIVYSFFLETILGNMPGYLKRLSVGFYTRCLMFSSAENYGVRPPERAEVYWPVTPLTAWLVLLGGTVVVLGIGMLVFSRKEFHDES